MRDTLHIFRKDLRRLWPLACGVLVLLAIECWRNIEFPRHVALIVGNSWTERTAMIRALAYCLGLGVLIQQERLVGDRQYWITRPISWCPLIASKALFIAAFFVVPVLVLQSAALLANGFSPTDNWRLMLWNLVLLAMPGAVFAAIAAVTRNIVQFLFTTLVAVAGLIFVSDGMQQIHPSDSFVSTTTIGSIVASGGILAVCLAVLLLQYARRRTGVARSILVALGIFFTLPTRSDWHAGFAEAVARSRDASAAHPIELRFNSAAPPAPDQGLTLGEFASTRISIPVMVSGIPRGLQLASQRIAASVEAPDGSKWTWGWQAAGRLASYTDWSESTDWLPAEGSYWASVNIAPEFYGRIKDTPVRLRLQIALAAFTSPETTTMPLAQQHARIPGACVFSVADNLSEWRCHSCRTPGPSGPPLAEDFFGCANPFHFTNAVRVRFDHGQSPGYWQDVCTPNYSPLPGTFDLSPWEMSGGVAYGLAATFQSSATPTPTKATIEVRGPLAYFEREIEIPSIRLGNYETSHTLGRSR
ncbi:MAG: hypothetical protein ABSC23_08445 [Bryobacteraceae bacterium]|jgi:hypothetical protein